ncbi:hypothetical protein SO802_025829 [Lithocarpus litseifolius]|uniref:Uncharacterized protein n=1 Tax=Lithocarpus litseifolius TaxID=425828 RepID=A0AAW2C1G2_9ROSI
MIGNAFKLFPTWFTAWFPLNKCGQAELYLPWKCETKCHIYEKWEYELVKERMIKMKICEQEANSKSGKKSTISLIPNIANAS